MRKRATKYSVLKLLIVALGLTLLAPYSVSVILVEVPSLIKLAYCGIAWIVSMVALYILDKFHARAKVYDRDQEYRTKMMAKIFKYYSPFIGTEEELLKHYIENEPIYHNLDEIITGAANRNSKGIIFATKAPFGGHGHSYTMMNEMNPVADEGFITSKGRFVDRYEGFRIADAAGQVKTKGGPDKELFSEDMWNPDYTVV